MNHLFYFTILYWFCHTLIWIHHEDTCVPHSVPPSTSLPIPSLWVIPEVDDIKKRWQEYTEELYKKYFNDLEYHNGVITHLEPDTPEWVVKWFLGSITMKKGSGGDGIPAELFQILKDDAMKVLHSICQQLWKTQQWPHDWKNLVFIPIPKKGNAKECSNC